ncbi:transcription factor of the MADS box [Vanrija albida]|uniref:Transcription factor of the MADS box n=1 Tax=Vanrija albida TaxID=181172 RepID=A0ABR3Q0K1_9TREE
MSRTVSINMDGLGDYNDTTEHFDSLDTSDMVADFGDGMGVDMNFGGHGDDEKVVDSELSKSSAMLTPTSTQMQLDATHMQLNQAQAALGGSHHPRSVDDMFHSETGLEGGSDDDDDSPLPPKRRRETQDVPGGFTYVDKESGESGRRKIRIEYITDKSRRHITFSKRKAGIMKKAYELSILTGTQVLLLVVSETGLVYTFTTTKLQPLVTKAEGKNLIQACLNAPDGLGPDGQPSGGPIAPTKGKNGGLSIRPHKLTAEASKAMLATAAQVAGATPDEAAAHATAQQEAVAAIGNGTPVSSRPKKRLPSKKRTASQHSIPDVQSAPELIPPVPPIPDMHRQHSPSTHLLPHQHAPPPQPPPNPLQSPLSAGYHMPQEYQHHAHPAHGVPSPTYAYPPTPTGGDYAAVQGYYPHAPPGHQGFVVHPGMYQSVPPPQQQQHGQQDRRMMPGGDAGMRMGM